MNKKRVGQFFLTMALALILGLGFFEYVHRSKKSDNPNSQCQITDVNVEEWPESESLLHVAKGYVVAFSATENKIKNYRWLVNSNKLKVSLDSEIGLICQSPDYNCFQKDLRDQKIQLKVVYFKPPYGLAKVRYGSREMDFPLFWDAKSNLKIGSPIQMCAKALDSKSIEMSVVGSRLYVYQNATRLFSGFELGGLTGAGPMSASREPDEMYVVSNSGRLSEASCGDAQSSAQAMFWVPHNDSFVFYSPSESLSLYFYDRSLNGVQLSDEKPNWVVRADKGYLFVEKNSLTVISHGKKDVKTVPGLSEFTSKGIWSLSSFFWDELNYLGAIEERMWLSERKVNMINLSSESRPEEQMSLGFSWRSQKEEFSASISDDFKFLYHWEQSYNGDLSMKSVSCR